ncbi:hypothetical protein BC939DRAFT_497677 [Gamsiella multidivaricata]|nr:uncharacterized protein BC939DRAFT_497677 [Gamsiella multidivaricata]KAI7816059.1 hypothetical protein BC939DRAFT_497677 [Gamsiella multidivaricata]
MKDIVIHCSFESDMFQHCGLKELYASINQVFTMDPSFPGAPSLFIHFPNLEDWNTEYRTPTPTISMDVIAKDVARYCPLLKGLHTGTGGDITKDLLLQVFRNLSTIVVSYKILSADIVTAILSHHNTLEHLMTFIPHDGFLESDNVPALTDQLQHSRRAIDLLPQLCTKLKLLCLSLHEMHIDEIEQVTWGCKGLEALHIRIHGLNTKEKIDRTIQLWRDGRAKSTALKDGAGALQCDTSIEARVARHLLRFEKLRKIWLGHKIRTINGPL